MDVHHDTPRLAGSGNELLGGLLEAASRAPDSLAIKTPGESLTYGELDRLTNRMARAIEVSPQRRPVVVHCRSELLFHAASIGVLKAGRPVIRMHPGEPEARRALILDESEADTILVDGHAPLGAAESGRRVVDLSSLPDDDRPLGVAIDADDVAVIFYTSGSTGVPKGVVHSYRSVAARSSGFSGETRLTADDRVLLLSRLSILETYAAFMLGAAIYTFDVGVRGFGDLADWMRSERISVMRSTPSTLRAFAPFVGEGPFPDLRIVVQGGETFSPSDLDIVRSILEPDATLLHLYGSTEAGIVTTEIIDDRFGDETTVLPAGRPIPGVRVEIVGSDGQPVPDGDAGMIVASTPGLALGYLGREALTSERFVGEGEDRKFVTGDIGRWDDEGRLIYVGRDDNQVKVRGNRVEIAEVEEALRRVPGLDEVAVVAAPGVRGSTRLIGYFTHATPEAPSPAFLREGMGKLVPSYMIPTAWVAMTSFPMTTSGKINRKALPGPSRTAAGEGVSDVSSRLAAIWARLLGVENVSPEDSFFDLGGDSLAAAGLTAAVEQEFGLRIPVADLLEHDTLHDMGAAIDDAEPGAGHGLLFPIKRSGEAPPLFCFHMPAWPDVVYWPLSRRIGASQPVVGVLDARAPVAASRGDLGDLADRYAAAIRAEFEGPYRVVGHSAGGVIAYEVARRLVLGGSEVDFVGLLDPGYPEGWTFPFRRLGRAVRRHGLAGLASRLGRRRPQAGTEREAVADPTLRSDQLGLLRAFHRHRIQEMDAPIVYFAARDAAGFEKRLRRWRPFVTEVVEVSGTHTGPDSLMSEIHAEETGSAVRSAIERVAGRP